MEIHTELVPYLVKSLQGAEISRSGAETRADVVDPAVPPTTLAAPVLLRGLLVAAFLGLFAGSVFVLLREPHALDGLASPSPFTPLGVPGLRPGAPASPPISPGNRPLYRLNARIRC